MNRTYYETPKPSKLMLLFWKIAGADRYLLEKATYQDQIKYFCLGGIILATGVMAALAGGYAFYTIFSPKTDDVIKILKIANPVGRFNPEDIIIPTDIPTAIFSIFFGLIWGLVIFNIDRFIVTSTGKGDGTEKITWDEFKGAIPRIVMGIIIAITISKPVEIRMFQTEINLAISKEQQKEKQIGIENSQISFDKKMKDLKTKLGSKQSDIDSKEKLISDLRVEISDEITGKNGNGANEGPRARALEKQVITLTNEVNSIKNSPEYLESKNQEMKFESEKIADIKYSIAKAASLDGLLIRIQKLHELAPYISLFITLLFLVIELTPIFFKLMLIKTPYDYMEENIKELIKAENGIEVKYNYYADDKSREGMEQHLVINHNVEKEIYQTARATEVQKELMDYAIEKYTEKMKAKIDANPEDYIKEEELNKMNPKEA
jgi:Domain of unknown function (DUF4407)